MRHARPAVPSARAGLFVRGADGVFHAGEGRAGTPGMHGGPVRRRRLSRGRKAELYHRLRKRFPATAAQALAVKALNICLARYHLRARSDAVLSRPIGLVVDPSNLCQLACPGCVHSEGSEKLKLFDWPKGTLSEDRFSALLKLYGPYAVGDLFLQLRRAAAEPENARPDPPGEDISAVDGALDEPLGAAIRSGRLCGIGASISWCSRSMAPRRRFTSGSDAMAAWN